MGRSGGVNQRVTLPALQEFFRVLKHGIIVFVIRSGKVEDGFAQHAAHTGGFRFFGDGILKIIHVRKSGDAAADLLRQGEARSPTHKFLIHVLGLGGKNEFRKPFFQSHVIFQAPEQSHGCVGVAIDEPRKHQLARCVD